MQTNKPAYVPAKNVFIYSVFTCKDGCIMKKLYNFRLEEKLIKDVDKVGENRTTIVTSALQFYLQRKDSVGTDDLHCKDDMESDMYNTAYNDLYNVEVLPLKSDLKHLNDTILYLNQNIEGLNTDKKFLQSQINGLMMIKSPMLLRFKTWLLKAYSKE